MNRGKNDNFQNKNHYADFDEHGNALTGNTNSLSHYNPESKYGYTGQPRNNSGDSHRQRGHRDTNAAHAYGDFSGGTRYGEGGSTAGGGSAYGHSYYGLSGDQGPRITQHDRHWDDSRRYDGYGDREHYRNRDRRFSDSFGRTSDGGYINENRPNQNFNYYDDSYQNPPFRDMGREERGYGRGEGSYERRGFQGNNRYESRERNAYRNEEPRYRSDNERFGRQGNEDRDRFYRDRGW